MEYSEFHRAAEALWISALPDGGGLVQEEPELITYPRAGASHLPPSSFSRTNNERGADAWPEPRPPFLTSTVATGSPSFMPQQLVSVFGVFHSRYRCRQLLFSCNGREIKLYRHSFYLSSSEKLFPRRTDDTGNFMRQFGKVI